MFKKTREKIVNQLGLNNVEAKYMEHVSGAGPRRKKSEENVAKLNKYMIEAGKSYFLPRIPNMPNTDLEMFS